MTKDFEGISAPAGTEDVSVAEAGKASVVFDYPDEESYIEALAKKSPADRSPSETLLLAVVGKITLDKIDEQVIAEDFKNFANQYLTRDQQDAVPKTFNEMDDEELYRCLSEYLGSGVATGNINGAVVETAQEILREQYMSEDELEELPNPVSARGQEIKQRKLQEAMQALLEDQERAEERRALSERDKEILGAQNIDLGNGKSASALDIVNSMDKILDNWDQSFDEMVDQGIAEPQDKDKLKSSMTKYRNMMADTKLSAAEKQKLREQMIKDGLLTQAQMDYLDQQAEQQKGREYNQDLHKENQVGKQQISVEARASALAEPEVTSAKNPATQGFSTVAPSGIDTEVKLTETYNIKSLAAAANDQKEISTPTVTITPKAPVQSVSGDMGFG